MRRARWLVVCVLLLVGGQPAWAARTRVHDAAESMQYQQKFWGMLGRGVLNVATSFVDVIVNVVNDTKAQPPPIGTLTGLAKGVGCGALRLGSGAVDLVTFWVPGFNGFPVSDSYENCLTPSSSTPAQAPLSGIKASVPSWEVPTTEPGAAQPPAQPAKPKRSWSK